MWSISPDNWAFRYQERRLLSAKGLESSHGNPYSNDFTFMMGSATYPCCSFIASFRSLKLTRLQCHPTITSYSIQTNGSSSEYGRGLTLGEGSPVALPQSNMMFLLDVSMQLESAELCDLVFACFDGKFEAAKDALVRTIRRDMNCRKDVADLASHLWERGKRILKDIEYGTLCAIFGSVILLVEIEDWVCERLLRVIRQDANRFRLLTFIYLAFVPCEIMRQFASVISDLLHMVHSAVWGDSVTD